MPKFTLLQLAKIIGAVTASDFLSESFSSPPYDFDVQEAIEICRLDVSCAGVLFASFWGQRLIPSTKRQAMQKSAFKVPLVFSPIAIQTVNV